MPISEVVYVKSMIKVIFLCKGRVVFPGSLFCIKSYASITLSSPATSLISPQCMFYSALWELKYTRRTSLPSTMLLHFASVSTLLLVLLSTPFHTWYAL